MDGCAAAAGGGCWVKIFCTMAGLIVLILGRLGLFALFIRLGALFTPGPYRQKQALFVFPFQITTRHISRPAPPPTPKAPTQQVNRPHGWSYVEILIAVKKQQASKANTVSENVTMLLLIMTKLKNKK